MGETTNAATAVPVTGLLGNGDCLTGRIVEAFGQQWMVSGTNYIDDWDIVRFEQRGDVVMRIGCSISSKILPADHPHCAHLLPLPNAPHEARRPNQEGEMTR